jgi:hypothetical protein
LRDGDGAQTPKKKAKEKNGKANPQERRRAAAAPSKNPSRKKPFWVALMGRGDRMKNLTSLDLKSDQGI